MANEQHFLPFFDKKNNNLLAELDLFLILDAVLSIEEIFVLRTKYFFKSFFVSMRCKGPSMNYVVSGEGHSVLNWS